MSTTETPPPVSQFDLETTPGQGGIGEAAGAYWDRIKGGDLGALPAVFGVVVLVIVFGVLEPDVFLTEQNFANLINQGAAIMVMAMGLVFVLLLGEIDLSAGFTAGTGAAILGVTLTEHGWAWPLSVLAALATGVVIGFTIALLVARLGIPSFVVTLSYFLGLQGAMLLIIGEGGTIPIRNDAILAIMNKNMPVALGWLLAVIVIGGFAATSYYAIRSRRKAGLQTPALSVWAAKVAGLAIVMIVFVYLLNQERQRPNAPITIQGVPWVVPLVGALVVGLSFLLDAHRVRPPRLRRRRQRRGRAARRHRRREHQDHLLHHVLDAGGRRRHPDRQPRQLRLADHRRRADAAVRGRRGGDRRHVAVRRARQDHRRRHRRPGGGDHRQRPPAGHAEVGDAVHHQRPRAAAGRERRRHLP